LRAWIESHRASLLDSLRRLGKQPIGSFFTCLVMAVALSMPMGLSLLLSNVERLGGSGSARRRFRCTCSSSQPAEGERCARDQGHAGRGRCRIRQPRSGAGRVPAAVRPGRSPRAAGQPAARRGAGDAEEVDKPALEALRQKLSELPKVQQAQLDLVWVERLAAILKLGDRFVFGLTVLLVSALLLVIGNTIRLHIENRRTRSK
jgi:cell division transport system permease protein